MTRHETIFISVASYRDKLCPNTLISIYEMAKHPERIYVGLCQQNNTKDLECMMPRPHPLFPIIEKNVRKINLPHTEAKGPTYARFICASLFRGEDYFMQIDSHTLLVQDWDEILLEMFAGVEKKGVQKVVLSHYPPAMEDYSAEIENNKLVTTIEKVRFNSHGIPVFEGAFFRKPGPAPKKNYFISANFLFARGQILKDVPFDPSLPFLFEGEEILYSVRAYTHGYNVFTPNKNVIFHHYIRGGEPKFWDDMTLHASNSIMKTKHILGFPIELKEIKDPVLTESVKDFGNGSERTVEQYWQETGINIYTQKSPLSIDKFFTSPFMIFLYVVISVLLVILIILLLI